RAISRTRWACPGSRSCPGTAPGWPPPGGRTVPFRSRRGSRGRRSGCHPGWDSPEDRRWKGLAWGGAGAAVFRRAVFRVVRGASSAMVAVPRREIMAIHGEELALACAKAADGIQAENIRVWDMRGVSTLTDYMIVCSGNSMPHLRAVIRDIATAVEEANGNKPSFTEGKADTRWVVLDYVDVM